MAAYTPPVVAHQVAPRESTPPSALGYRFAAAPAAAKELDAAQQAALLNGKRKQQGQHITTTGAAAPAAAPGAAPGARASKPAAKKPASKPQKKPVARKPVAKKPVAKMASLTALTASMGDARKVLDNGPALEDAPDSYVELLNDASVDIDSPPLRDYADDMEAGLKDDDFGGEDADVKGEYEVQEIEEGAFEGAVAKVKGKAVRTGNYSVFKDVILIKAWKGVKEWLDRNQRADFDIGMAK